jgi:hypothetical protein
VAALMSPQYEPPGRENALETRHEFVRSKNIRFPSGRGVVPVWPPRDS